MTKTKSHTLGSLAVLVASALTLLCAGPATAASSAGPGGRLVKPLSLRSPGAYAAEPVCATTTQKLGRDTCMALRVVASGGARLSPARRAALIGAAVARGQAPAGAPSPKEGGVGYTPQELAKAYELEHANGSPPTIALVDAYNDPTAEEDLKTYSEEFKLPSCEAGCFAKYNQRGETTKSSLPFPKSTAELNAALSSPVKAERERGLEAEGWGVEISLDIETAHAICQQCHIALVEAESPETPDFATAETAASTQGKASVISNSWGGPECVTSGELECEEPVSAFDQPGVVITASTGDDGYLNWQRPGSEFFAFPQYPASSPDVVAVGGTRLALGAKGEWQEETVWNGNGAGGGGCSQQFEAQIWQRSTTHWRQVGCGVGRADADVSADADPFTGLAVYYSRTGAEGCLTEYEGEHGATEVLAKWCQIGGTSLASPLVAAAYALAGGSGGRPFPAATLYENEVRNPASLHDVTVGSNGECPFAPSKEGLSGCTQAEEARQCASAFICQARAGYDGPTGVGTPRGLGAFEPGETGTAFFGGEEKEEEPPVGRGGPGPPLKTEGSPGPGSSGPPTTSSSTPGQSLAVVVSHLGLTTRALLALAGGKPKLSTVAFSFLLNRDAQVKVSFYKRVRVHRRLRWRAVGRPFVLSALTGHDSGRLHGSSRLSAGRYRLTLTPAPGGAARSIEFSLG